MNTLALVIITLHDIVGLVIGGLAVLFLAGVWLYVQLVLLVRRIKAWWHRR